MRVPRSRDSRASVPRRWRESGCGVLPSRGCSQLFGNSFRHVCAPRLHAPSRRVPAALPATSPTPRAGVCRFRTVSPAAPQPLSGLVPFPRCVYCRGQRPGSGRTDPRSQANGSACRGRRRVQRGLCAGVATHNPETLASGMTDRDDKIREAIALLESTWEPHAFLVPMENDRDVRGMVASTRSRGPAGRCALAVVVLWLYHPTCRCDVPHGLRRGRADPGDHGKELRPTDGWFGRSYLAPHTPSD